MSEISILVDDVSLSFPKKKEYTPDSQKDGIKCVFCLERS